MKILLIAGIADIHNIYVYTFARSQKCGLITGCMRDQEMLSKMSAH